MRKELVKFDLRTALPTLLPKAVDWAQRECASVLQAGQPLDQTHLSLARSVGVQRPELIRVAEVDTLPQPEDPELRKATLVTGLLGPRMIGLTFGYAVFVCHGHKSTRLLSHEFRHVYQYEQCGSIEAFLPAYLLQIVTFGYEKAPFETDARAHESETTPKPL